MTNFFGKNFSPAASKIRGERPPPTKEKRYTPKAWEIESVTFKNSRKCFGQKLKILKKQYFIS
jgi:hypothetical protein